MATLKQVLDSQPDALENTNRSLSNIKDQIAELEDTRLNYYNDILVPSQSAMEDFINSKQIDLETYEYSIVYPGSWWDGEIPTSVSQVAIIRDWTIRRRLIGSGSWQQYYTYQNAVDDNVQSVIDANTNFDYAWDLIVLDPADLEGTYGINSRIESLNTGKNIVEKDKAKIEDTISILGSMELS